MKRKINISGESYTHIILWKTVKYQMEAAARFPNRNMYFYLTAMLMAFFTLEAYLNYLGEIVDPDTWKNEKDFFRRQPYIGTIGKFNFLVEKCEMKQLDRGKRPYQTINQLNRIRDFLAHGKTERFTKSVKYKEGYSPEYIRSYLEGHISEKKANISLKDTEQVINELHMAAKAKFPDMNLCQQPLNDSLRSQFSEVI